MSRYARTASSGDQSLLSAGDRTLQRGREAVVEPNGHIVVKRWKPRFSKNMPSRTMLSISVGELIQMPAVFRCGFFGEVHFDLQTALIAKREDKEAEHLLEPDG